MLWLGLFLVWLGGVICGVAFERDSRARAHIARRLGSPDSGKT